SARSARSGGSKGTCRYRAVAKSSEVDESLFKAPKPDRSGAMGTGKPVRASEILPGSTVVTVHELEEIRRRAVVRAAADEAAERARVEHQHEVSRENEKQLAARERKERMLKMEEDARLKAKRSDIEIEHMAREQLIKKLAGEKLDQNNDIIKTLQSLGARAAAFTIRDAQLAEKASREESERAYESRMDMVMELDRLRDLRRRE
ncbi:unnamed protein product, partial [Phaeothamnion confervicola]